MLEGKTVSGSPQQSKASKISRNNSQNFKSRKNNRVSSSCNAINPGQRFSLLLEHCSPCPVPGPLLSPLLGGLPGNSPLTGGQAASLQLAQLKTQLALTQMNNVFAVGGQAATLRANTNASASRLSTTPPSPTAVAINLLNLLKIANTMSHPMYNPFVSGKQSSSQGQYGLASGQTERDPRKAQPHRGSGSSFSSSGATSLTLGTSGGPVPSPLALPVNYRPERGRIAVDEDIDRCLDLHISRAREEVRHQPPNQNVCFSGNQRDEFPSSSTGMTPFLTFSASQGHRPSGDHGSRSLDWLPVCERTTEDDSSNMYPSASSSFLGSGDGRFNVSNQGKCDMQSIPGLGDFDNSMPDKSAPPQESGRPKYTSESASNILLHFGLEKEDLEHLISYPEDQITPENLPFILRQIRIDKTKRAPSAVQSKPYNEPQHIPSVSGISSRGTALTQDEIPSIVLKPSKVIDYGHTGKYTGGVGGEIGRTIGGTATIGGSGSMLHTDTFKSSSHSREPLQQSSTEMTSGSFVSSHDQMASVTSFSSLRSSAASSSGPTQPNQTSKSIFSSFSSMSKDVDLRRLNPDVPKLLPSKQPEADPQPASKPSCTLFRGVHPGRPGLVLIGSNDESHNANQSRTQAQASKVPEQIKKQQVKQQPKQQTQQHQGPPPQKQQQKPLVPRVISTTKTGAPTSTTSAQPVPSLMSMTSSRELFPAKVGVCKLLPTPAMMEDYAATTPRIFPHTCCLCNKECTKLKDWLTHQNTSLHLENCRCLRSRYPDWNGEALAAPSVSGKDAKPSSSTSAQTSQNRQLKSRRDSRSRSRSPRRRLGSEDRRERRSSRSRSRSPRRRRTSEDRRQKRSSRSRSRSPRHHYGSESRRERRDSTSRSPLNFRNSRRSRPRSFSPRYDHSSRYRSRSRSFERRLSPRRREDRRSSPRRSCERRWSPRRSDDRRSSPRRSRERRSSADRVPQQTRSRSAERLAKRLLETSAVQSLSKQSDLEAMVKTLAPALLAELNKMKSSSSAAPSSSSSNAAKKSSSSKSTKAKSSETSSSTKSTATTASSSTKVRLKAEDRVLRQHDVAAAVEKFGKVESVVLYRSGMQAIVCFEKEEDAEKLRNIKSLDVNGTAVSVLREVTQSTEEQKTPETKEQKAAPQQKSVKSKASTTKSGVSTTKSGVSTTKSGVSTTKSTSTGKAKTPSTSASGAKNTTTSKATKAKVPASNSKAVSTKQVNKTTKTVNSDGKRVAKVAQVKKETSAVQKSKSAEKKPDAKDSKQKATNTKSEGDANKPAAAPAVVKSNTAAAEPNKKKKTVPEANKTTQKPKTQPEQEAGKKGKVGEKSTTSEHQPKVQEATLVHKDPVKADKPPETGVKVEPEEAGPVEPVGLGETGVTEPMEAESSTDSKDPELTEGKTKPAVSPPAATSTDTPQRPGTTYKTEETSMKVSSVPDSESAMENLKFKTETLEKQQQPDESPAAASSAPEVITVLTTLQDSFSGVKTKQDSEPAVSPEAASPAKTKPTDEPSNNQHSVSAVSSAPDVAAATVKEETEKQRQQEETSCVQVETVVSSTPPAEHSVNVGQPTPQDITSVSTVAAPSAGLAVSEEMGSADTDMKEAEKPKAEVVANADVSPKASEDVKEEQSPGTPVISADKTTIAASPTATVPVTDPVASRENAAELPLVNEDIFRAIATALHEHRLTKQSRTKSEDKESTDVGKKTSVCAEEENTKEQDDAELKDNSSDVTDEPDFNFEDFVTVDEISEDMEETAVHDSSSSSKSTSKEKTEKKSSDVSSKKKTPSKTSKDGKSPTSASSKSTKSRSSSSSTSVSVKKQKQPPEANKRQTKASSSTSGSKTSSSSSSKSTETPSSPRRKAQSSKTKSPVRASQPSSSGRSTRSSAAALRSSGETQQSHKKEEKPTQSAVAKSDHKVSAESNAAKSVESELKTEPLKMDTPAQGHKLELIHQTQTLKTTCKDESLKEVKKSKEEEKVKDGDQNLDSLEERADETMKKEGSSTETHTLGSEKDQMLHFQVSDRAADDGKVCSEECSEMEVDAFAQEQEGATKTQTSTAGDEDEGSKVMQVTEGDGTQVVRASEKPSVDDAADINQDTSQTPTSRGGEQTEIPSDGSRRTSKDAPQVYDEDLPFKNTKDDLTEQENLRTLDSTDDQIVTEDKVQKLEAPSDHTLKPGVGPTEEEEDVYQVIDSVEDQPTTTETESETDKEAGAKKSNALPLRDDRPSRSSRSRSRTSKSEDKEKSPKKQDKTVKKYETRAKDIKTGSKEKTEEDTEEMVFEVVDSVEGDSVQEASATEGSGGRQTDVGHTEDEKILNPVEVPEQPEEEMYKILDSVEDETVTEKPAVTRSTRGRKEKTKKVTENEKNPKDKTPTRRRNTPVRESHERESEKTPKTVPSKESSPTKKSEAVRDTSEEEATYQILDAVEEDDQPTPPKPKRGRPKKDSKSAKKQTAASKKSDLLREGAEEEATYQVLDSVGDGIAAEQVTDQAGNTQTSVSATDDSLTKNSTMSPENKEEEEPMYQIVDSLDDDQFQEELMTEVSTLQEEDKREAANVDSVEVLKEPDVEKESLLQGVKVDPSGDVGRTSQPAVQTEESLTESNRDAAKSEKTTQKATKKKDTTSKNALVSLDDVSEEEEDYPDDTAEEEELKTRQAAAEEQEHEREERRTKERGSKERRSQSSSGETVKKLKEMCLESQEAESQELVTLDEVGEDEAAEGVTDGPKSDRETGVGDLQELVTLDEIVEEEEDGMEGQIILEPRPLSQESQSGDSLKPEMLSALDEVGQAEEEKEEINETSSSVKRKHDENTEESEDFVTLDEVGVIEEEENKAATTTRGRPKKKSRQTPVRKSTRGKTESKEHTGGGGNQAGPPGSPDSSSTPDKDSSTPSGDVQLEIQTTESQSDQQPQSESPDEQKPGGVMDEEEEGHSRADVRVADKRKAELIGPEAKRPRSQSPSGADDFQLPPFNPQNPQGQEFVVPKSGFFCNLCSMFYLSESAAKKSHCSSQKHYNNLLKHYQALQDSTSRSSTQSSLDSN